MLAETTRFTIQAASDFKAYICRSRRLEKPSVAVQNPNSIGNKRQLTAEQLAAVKAFIEQVGGIENARRAVDAIRESMKAA